MAKTILVVDDEVNIARLVEMNLRRAGYEVLKAEDGLHGLEVAAASHPDLILLDVNMPRMDGIEMLRRLKADDTLRDTPVILVTAKSQDADILHGTEAGADHYVTKPVNPMALLALIEQLFAEHEGGGTGAA